MERISERRPAVLLYNMSEGADNEKICEYLEKTGVRVIHVRTTDYRQPLGALAGVPGYERTAEISFGKTFEEPMLVMFGFDDLRMNAFFAFFRQAGIPSVGLKAVITPTNAAWDSIRLHEEIAAEHAAMHKDKR